MKETPTLLVLGMVYPSQKALPFPIGHQDKPLGCSMVVIKLYRSALPTPVVISSLCRNVCWAAASAANRSKKALYPNFPGEKGRPAHICMKIWYSDRRQQNGMKSLYHCCATINIVFSWCIKAHRM